MAYLLMGHISGYFQGEGIVFRFFSIKEAQNEVILSILP